MLKTRVTRATSDSILGTLVALVDVILLMYCMASVAVLVLLYLCGAEIGGGLHKGEVVYASLV
jgi:hypothetical protein